MLASPRKRIEMPYFIELQTRYNDNQEPYFVVAWPSPISMQHYHFPPSITSLVKAWGIVQEAVKKHDESNWVVQNRKEGFTPYDQLSGVWFRLELDRLINK